MPKEHEYEEAYAKLLEVQEEQHKKNVKRIRWGIKCAIFIPLIFMILMFVMDSSKTTYLILWIASMFLICGYIIYVEYIDFSIQKLLTDSGLKNGEIQKLLPEKALESRLLEIERYVGESVVSIKDKPEESKSEENKAQESKAEEGEKNE